MRLGSHLQQSGQKGEILALSCSRLEWPLPPIMEPSGKPTVYTLHLKNSIWRPRSPLTILSFSPPAHSGPAPLSLLTYHTSLGFIISLCSSWGGHMTISSNRFQALQEHNTSLSSLPPAPHHYHTPCLRRSSKSAIPSAYTQ